MKRKKVCLLGAFAVGKTSLVARFVHSIFDERYHTTIGVKIDKKEVTLRGASTTLVLWDLYGEDKFQRLEASYLRGAHGFLIVVDGTRAWTLDHALEMLTRAKEIAGDVPHVMLLNKHDLAESWELSAERSEALATSMDLVRTSAKSGEGVEAAFERLVERMEQR